MCNFVGLSHANSLLHWSVIHYRDNPGPGPEYHERKYFIRLKLMENYEFSMKIFSLIILCY